VPFWIAGGGEQLTLRLTAQYASYANFGEDLEDFKRRSGILADHCREIGRDFDEIVRSHNFNLVCAETESEVKERLGWLRSHFAEVLPDNMLDKAMRDFAVWAGTPDQIIERLLPWKEAGLSYFISYVPEAAYDRSGLELIGTQVAPAL
jgi:alkanesulfonate monooxygenase SsuD/methylene tetrahydromethanopterin reductase-like flavin-dependent oxidoreductase (luciferase family)